MKVLNGCIWCLQMVLTLVQIPGLIVGSKFNPLRAPLAFINRKAGAAVQALEELRNANLD